VKAGGSVVLFFFSIDLGFLISEARTAFPLRPQPDLEILDIPFRSFLFFFSRSLKVLA